MDTQHDERALRCRRLGHPVPFRYCRTESGERPCRLLLDCWWQTFDVLAWARENLPEEVVEQLENRPPPPNKMASIADLIEEARKRLNEKKS